MDCFQSQVVGAGPQLGFIIPLTAETQGYLNLKSYWEFANQNRPDGWNAWVTFVISPAENTPERRTEKNNHQIASAPWLEHFATLQVVATHLVIVLCQDKCG